MCLPYAAIDVVSVNGRHTDKILSLADKPSGLSKDSSVYSVTQALALPWSERAHTMNTVCTMSHKH